jgi:F-type H+-transporting ATPase subunit a
MVPVELISTYVRPFTLAVRLFGNIFGEDVIILVLAGLGTTMGGTYLGWLPLQFPVLLLALLTDGVQAMVFSILVCIYISLNSHHEEGEHGEEGPISGAAHAHGAGH